MPDPEVDGVTPTPDPENNNPDGDELPPVDPPADDDPDKGAKAALVAEREARRQERDERKQMRVELDALKQQLADRDKPAEELALEQARREAEQAVLEKANARIVRSELKAAAAGKVKRPDLLIKITDLSAIEVDENGDPDADALNDAITTFLEEYPELSVEARSPGSADQGSQRRQAKPPQLTNDDIDRMTPEEIETARKEGRLNKLMGVS